MTLLLQGCTDSESATSLEDCVIFQLALTAGMRIDDRAVVHLVILEGAFMLTSARATRTDAFKRLSRLAELDGQMLPRLPLAL